MVDRMTYQPSLALSAPSDGSNNSTAALTGGATFTGTAEFNEYQDVMVSCQTDAPGRLYFDFSVDGTNWGAFPVSGFRLDAGIHEFHTAVKGPRYFRVRLVNDASAQSYLRLSTYFGSFAKPPSAPLNQSVANDADASVVRAVSDEIDTMLGLYSGRFIVNKFGRNADIDTGSVPEDIWAAGGLYTGFPAFASPETISVFSSDGTDSSADVGLRTIRLYGLDANGDAQTEDVILSGATPVATTATWTRMNRMVALTAGTSLTNVGTITARHTTTTANVFSVMPIGTGQTQICCYTVPANHTAYLKRYSAAMDDNTANTAQLVIWTQDATLANAASRQLRPFTVSTAYDYVTDEYGSAATFTELTDIAMRCTSIANSNGIINGEMSLLVVRDKIA
jgi:hypothetical protein